MRGTAATTTVLSALELDVLWEAERLPRRHVAFDVPSPGTTHTERAALVAAALDGLQARGLVSRGRAVPELVDALTLLAHPKVSVDGWVWTDRQIRSFAAAGAEQAVLAAVDNDEVWLIPARPTALAEAAVSISGSAPAGPGRSVTLPTELLLEADKAAGGNPQGMVTTLYQGGVLLADAQALASMLTGVTARGQFGAERSTGRERRRQRAERVVAFHDTEAGRYVYLARPSPDGRMWSTIGPADNARLSACVWELLDEV
ncbi:ESX secretion-associated protein EspG [Actinokineospora bangkokensis]|uniref:ESX secretion-associated protein EspG n=1 Tax=Actinokineospora bangkokensis TaxID=1193682 RepID=A0A1Q9LFV0_9PSEU|nr:ESX secretion-associated protein EspG [Actinokineospora bangkokensis]OLR90903.1 ESX secretion-associated protein EspG [Actinokineospora bangkokensis]